MAIILLGLALSFDSFQASMVLGTMRPGAASQIRLALAFGVCDGIAPLLGLSLVVTHKFLFAWAIWGR